MDNEDYLLNEYKLATSLLDSYNLVKLYYEKHVGSPISCIAKYRFKQQAKKVLFLADNLIDVIKHRPPSINTSTSMETDALPKNAEIKVKNIKYGISIMAINLSCDLSYFMFIILMWKNMQLSYFMFIIRMWKNMQLMYYRFVFYHICLTRYIINTLGF